MNILTIYRADIASITNTHERKAARLYWLRAVIETMQERSLTAMPVPVRKKTKAVQTIRFLPFWRSRTDAELEEFLDSVAPYWRRESNRGVKL